MQDDFVFSVSELTRHIKAALEPMYADILVEGEISNMKIPSSGHAYFTLKDDRSQIRAVMFRGARASMRFAPGDGMQVFCRGRINVYEPRGEYQLLVEGMQPKGAGELQLAFEQLKKKLDAEGLFDQAVKKPLPVLPDRVAVITSPTGAAVRDVVHVATRRFPGVSIMVVPVRVQGDEAPADIAEALDMVNRAAQAVVVILARGGGSIEDLWAFNDESVARAVFASTIPVISAVGHETDFTIADFVADVRAPTPSAAAELAVPDHTELVHRVARSVSLIRGSAAQCLEKNRSRLAFSASHLLNPRKRIGDFHQRCDEVNLLLRKALRYFMNGCATRTHGLRQAVSSRHPLQVIRKNGLHATHVTKSMERFMVSLTKEKRALLHTACSRLDAISPLNVLKRGYSITRRIPDLGLVKDAVALAAGDSVRVTFSRGEADCRVERVAGGHAGPPAEPKTR